MRARDRYVSEKVATSPGTNGHTRMIPGTQSPSPGTVSWGVDTKPTLGKTEMRRSIKLTSKTKFDVGEDKPLRSMLAVIDVAHVPTGCATWPAFWMANENSWPKYGEIDIIEATNLDAHASTTLHTCGPAAAQADDATIKAHCRGASNCTMVDVPKDIFTGSWNRGEKVAEASDCDIQAKGQYSNQGCSIRGPDGTYGSQLNAENGGIFATEWSMKDLSDKDADEGGDADLDPLDVPHIATWFFPRKDLPLPDEQWGAQPDTKTWGRPYAYFRLGKENCDPSHFSNQQIIFDTTLCGDDAGNKWGSSGCAARYGKGGTDKKDCEAFVRENGGNFTEAYWEVYNVSVWGVKTGIQPKPAPHPGSPTVEIGKYAIIAAVVIGVCIVGMCGWKCWIDSRESEFDRVGRRAENKARLNDTSGWEYSHEKQAAGRYGELQRSSLLLGYYCRSSYSTPGMQTR